MSGRRLPHERRSSDATALADVWEQTLPVTLERVALLEGFADAALRGQATAAGRAEAARVAGQLATFLVSFRRDRGSHAAAAVEQLLRNAGRIDAAHGRILRDLLDAVRVSLDQPARRTRR